MSVMNGDDPPPPPYSFVGSSRLSPVPSVRHSPPPYHHGPPLRQGRLSQNQSPQSPLYSNALPAALENPRLPRQRQHVPYHHRNTGQIGPTNGAPPQGQEFELRQDDLVIPIMGLTGSGRSSFISLLADGQGNPVARSPKGYTNDIVVYPYQVDQKTRVILVDTPGFNKASRGNITTLNSIANFLCLIYNSNIRIAGIIYLHDITARRMDSHALRNLHMFKKLCGSSGLSNVTMATTMWGKLGTFHEGESRERQLRDRYWSSILNRGGIMMRHTGSKRSAEEIVNTLLRKQQPIVLAIQQELVVHRQQLGDTAAGRELYAEISKEKQHYITELDQLRLELDEALRRKDFEYGQMLRETKSQLYKKIRLVEESKGVLRADFQRLKGEVREQEAGKKKKYFGRTALGIGVGTILGLTTGVFI
ncbi:hypothetical protein AJ78_02763 [Emergomyces pasteurianus Ep9510]|uniref:G domain-containing protein n=1 Tax=Emergomyces pasteurianus Ep9510 TaxID=1447872 RepID=A0A1J9QLR1_9EURO|nr:hypothetical protein AJ78_02763 [Emergomyces pasteurianus Ep9510]